MTEHDFPISPSSRERIHGLAGSKSWPRRWAANTSEKPPVHPAADTRRSSESRGGSSRDERRTCQRSGESGTFGAVNERAKKSPGGRSRSRELPRLQDSRPRPEDARGRLPESQP